MPAAQHRIAPFVATPFVFACKSEPLEKVFAGESSSTPAERHAIHTVMEWQNRLTADPGLTKVQLAINEGLSKPRITQMFTLLKLPKEAQDHLRALSSPAAIRYFSVKRLIAMAKLTPQEQQTEFEKLRANCDALAD